MIIEATLAAAMLFSQQTSPEVASSQPEAAAPAVEAAVEPTNQEVSEDSDADRLICRRTRVVGSRFSKRLCATKEEWENLNRRGRETTREFQQRGAGNEPPRG